MLPNPKEWETFYDRFNRSTKLDLYLYKPDQLRRRVASMADSKGFTTLESFSGWLETSAANTQWFMDKLAINVSELFRNPEKWRELETGVLPELISRNRRLKCWSAGCSYGAEAHTLATILHENFRDAHTIIGTDIDVAALDQAKRGEFAESDMRCVPDALKSKYFDRDGELWRAKDEVRRYCTFKIGNLLEEPKDNGFDLILCRNVVIYFTDDAKDQLYERFFRALKPGGILFVGGTERIFKSREIGYESPIPFFYQKPLQGVNTWRNAS